MPYTLRNLPAAAQKIPDASARRQWMHVFNRVKAKEGSDAAAFAQAFGALHNAGWRQNDQGEWVHKMEEPASTPDVAPVTVELAMRIAKADDTRQYIMGWASVAVTKDGTPLVDLQGDVIDIDDLDEAMHDYAKQGGVLNFDHDGPQRGALIGICTFTPEKLEKMGIPPGTVPLGTWVEYYIPDPADYAYAKANELVMFSIEGSALREEL